MLISYVRLDHTLYSINYGIIITCIIVCQIKVMFGGMEWNLSN